MKVTFIGTGNIECVTRCNTSVLVDNVLFDIGMGTIKQIERLKIYTKNITYVVISHFHSDHFLDIPNLLIGRRGRGENKNYKITIIGPIGLRKKVFDLMTLTHGDGNMHKYDSLENKYNIEFIELDSGKSYENDEFKLTAYALNHGNCVPIYGYILEKEGKKIAYATDTTFCDNFYKMSSMCNYMFFDVNSLKTNDMHIGLDDIKILNQKYQNCKFYAIHRGDYNASNMQNIEFPNDGDVIEI